MMKQYRKIVLFAAALCLLSGCGYTTYQTAQEESYATVSVLGEETPENRTAADSADGADALSEGAETSPAAETAETQPAEGQTAETTAAQTVAVSELEFDPQDSSYDLTPAYTFRNERLLTQHYEKHGIEMGFDSPEAYEQAASAVVENPDTLHKTEKEDGDDVYYLEETNEFVVVSTDGYIRTYFYPSAGIAYYERQ